MNQTNMNKTPRKRPRCRRWTTTCLILTVGFGSIANVSAQSDNGRSQAVEHMKKVLEQPFLEYGGFSEFDCTLTSSAKPTRKFTCSATAMENKQFEYLIAPDPGAGIVVEMVTEPAAQLDYVWLPPLEKACRRFLKNFNEANWSAIYFEFAPELQDIVSQTDLVASLVPIRDALGLMGEPELQTYTSRGDGGRDELQYKVPAKNGPAAFRCGLNSSENLITILAYLITPYPESELYKTMLEREAATQLSQALGKPVDWVKVPFEQLTNMYDVAESVGMLQSGVQFKIRVIRSGRLDDFSPKDYTFQVLKNKQ